MDYPEFIGQPADALFPYCPVTGKEPARSKDYHTRIRDGVFEVRRTIVTYHETSESNDGYRSASSYEREVDIWDRYGAVENGIIVFDQDRLDAYHSWYAPIVGGREACRRARALGYSATKLNDGSGWSVTRGYHSTGTWSGYYDEDYLFATLDEFVAWLDGE